MVLASRGAGEKPEDWPANTGLGEAIAEQAARDGGKTGNRDPLIACGQPRSSGGNGAGLITSGSCTEELPVAAFEVSSTLMEMVKVPATVGVPLSTQLGLKVSPAGSSVPGVTDQV